MSKSVERKRLELQPYSRKQLDMICGPCDENLHRLEDQSGVTISRRENIFSIQGESSKVAQVSQQLLYLNKLASTGKAIDFKDLHLSQHYNSTSKAGNADTLDLPCKRVKLMNSNQIQYHKNVRENTINFAIGPSGTGKTFLAVCFALQALLKKEVERIILVRPAVDAGEKLGFLPGDMNQKVDPYLRPFYDALYELISIDETMRYLDTAKIEIAPLAFMRGRTLSEAFIILDESQNTTVEQMKMLLTRLGHDSKMIITGDLTQIDLPRSQQSGLSNAQDVLADIEDIAFNYFSKQHVVRHNLIQSIIAAYER